MTRPEAYDQLFQQGQAVLDRLNPCQFKRHRDGSVSCTGSRNGGNTAPKFCCFGCDHWDNGCTVQSLACKLWLCVEARDTKRGLQAEAELVQIRQNAYNAGLPMYFRASKAENFDYYIKRGQNGSL